MGSILYYLVRFGILAEIVGFAENPHQRPHYLRRADLEPMTKGWYEFVCRSILPTTNIPFPSIIAALCTDAKIPAIADDTLIPKEPPILGIAMTRTRETRARNPRQARQDAPPQK
ncbi:hypothetical protein PIB30_084720 [Stylosanthes scabra]|uniref:Uncharacterized protein n=1 Tax=Stylosanthes scabra TaxID=79078 RepID=A0ABU6QT95_9FABA|nr:hypothetical protein [Stylosanthes scabra]